VELSDTLPGAGLDSVGEAALGEATRWSPRGRLGSPRCGRCAAGSRLELMRGVERLLDPAGLMNPGKVLPS
jgi:FAD/FMN-containing dehydrogenase